MELHSSPKRYVFDQSKAGLPAETVQKALSALRTLPGLEDVRISEDISGIRSYLHTLVFAQGINTCGKGLVPDQARAGAVREFGER